MLCPEFSTNLLWPLLSHPSLTRKEMAVKCLWKKLVRLTFQVMYYGINLDSCPLVKTQKFNTPLPPEHPPSLPSSLPPLSLPPQELLLTPAVLWDIITDDMLQPLMCVHFRFPSQMPILMYLAARQQHNLCSRLTASLVFLSHPVSCFHSFSKYIPNVYVWVLHHVLNWAENKVLMLSVSLTL